MMKQTAKEREQGRRAQARLLGSTATLDIAERRRWNHGATQRAMGGARGGDGGRAGVGGAGGDEGSPALASDAELVTEARKTLAVFQKNDPSRAKFAARSAGCAVFPTITKGAIGVGGAHGTGVLFVKGKAMGKASLTQVTIGAQLGGQEYSEVIFFETARAVADFEKGNAALSAEAAAVALKSGASADAKYKGGVAVFTATKGGLMADASVGGQKFGYEPFAHPR
jgi:Las17-binding protein actin regulator